MSFIYELLRFLVRGGTAANLATVNEVPLARELVIETDTRKMKLGNGITPYVDLPYISGAISMRVDGGWIQYAADGGTWVNLIAVSSLIGPTGPSIEMRVTATHVQWRVVGAPTWTNLITIAAITGPTGPNGINGTNGTDGLQVEMRSDGTFLQWRYVGASTWVNLIDVAAIGGSGSTVAQITFGAGDRINTVAPGDKAEIVVGYDCTINDYHLVIFTDDGLPGSVQLDVRKTSFTDYPSSFASICATAKPTISSDRKAHDATLTGWTTSVSAGDVLKTTVESRSSNVTQFALTLRTEKS